MPDDPCAIDLPLSFGVSAAPGRPLPQLDAASLAALFKVFEGGDAPAPGESAAAWLARHGSSLNIVDPHHGVPFYLLLVGDPTALPYEFQYTLDIYWAVGRLAFDTPDEYRRYAASVVAYETADPPPGRKRIAVFAPERGFAPATQRVAR